jgi:hypothetical protein
VLGVALTSCGGGSSPSAGSSSASTKASPSAAATTGGTVADTGSTAAAAGPGPCSLLTDAQAGQILGGTATHGPAVSQFRGVTCTWRASASFVSVSVYHGREFFAPSQQAPDGKAVTGIGDEAFVSEALAGARKGDLVVVVGGYGAGGAAGLEKALRLAVAGA